MASETCFNVSEGLLAGSTRSARLLRLTEAVHSTRAPVVLVPDLSDDGFGAHFVRASQLVPLFALNNRPLYLVQWSRPWVEGGGERFSPLVRDLNSLVQSVAPHHGAVHLATLGSGALIGFKWLSACHQQGNVAPAESLSLLAPSLSVLGRVPRTSTVNAPARTSIVSQWPQRDGRWAETVALAGRLPHAPAFFALREPDSYLVARNPSALSRCAASSDFIEFAGSWKQAWVDWIGAANSATQRLAG